MTSKVIALFVWAPQPISGFYIVKSAMRLINSGNLPIKKRYLGLRAVGGPIVQLSFELHRDVPMFRIWKG